MHIGGADYKLLEIFVAVVDAKGISNAQSILGKDSSTISRAITQLETRFGIHLCDRGRQGFSLTSEGFEIYKSSIALLETFRRLEVKVETIKGVSQGKLKIAMIDNIIGDSNCPLTPALRMFSGPASKGRLQTNIVVLNPNQMEQQLNDRQIDIAVGIFEAHKNHITYHYLYQEVDYLYCANDHPMSCLETEEEVQLKLKNQSFVTRKFLDGSELRILGIEVTDNFIHTDNIEALTQLILSGLCIGFIPHHFAAPWIKKGLLRPIMKQKYYRYSDIEAACLNDPASSRPAVESFLNCLQVNSRSQPHLKLIDGRSCLS